MESNVGFVDAIKEGEIVRIPKSQAREEDLFILRDIIEPVPEPEMPRVAQIKQETSYGLESPLDKWKMRRPSYKDNNVVKELVENFHWEIIKARRGKNLTRKQVADALKISEGDMKMIEFGELPSDDFVLVNKLENYLGVSLRKEKPVDTVTLVELQKMSESRVRAAIERVHRGETGKEKKDEDFSGDDIEILD